MTLLKRKIEDNIQATLERGKSVLLLGARQTGKTTLVEQVIKPDISYSLAQQQTRQRFEADIVRFEKELEMKLEAHTKKCPLVFIDEVQKVPRIMDIVQVLIDGEKAQFILTGSSARKLKHGAELNLLPGRVVLLTMPPLLTDELPNNCLQLNDRLNYGCLPEVVFTESEQDRDIDLTTYVSSYLEEEIRAEAVVRNIGSYTRFLELAAGEPGKQLNFLSLAQDIGVSDTTIASYYQILEDCLIALRVDPLITSATKRRLIKAPKYYFFDMGVRRASANEGTNISKRMQGDIFEHYIGVELIYQCKLILPMAKLRYWRDVNGPEVDFVLDYAQSYTPIEIKLTDSPKLRDARHLELFINEYESAEHGYIICQAPEPYRLTDTVTVLPWQQLLKAIPQTPKK